MNTLDIVLVLIAIVYAVSGYQQGFMIGLSSTVGLLLGGFIGVQATPLLLDRFSQGLSVSIAALLIVIACAFLGQALGAYLGSNLRTRITWRQVRVVDALGGAALSVVAMLLISWVLAVAASGAQMGQLNAQIRSSRILGAVDTALPGGADRLLLAFNSLVDSTRFPRYLEPFARERITNVPAPNAAIAERPGVKAAAASVVKIVGSASCHRTLEGSGFVYAPGRVMTNAHVVAGVDHPVITLGSSDYRADIVYYDSGLDVAVLAVDGLDAPSLHFRAKPAASGTPAAVLGYPENGPYHVEAARIRDQQTLRGPDIYGDGTVDRDTYSVYSSVRQGNSGGPLVDARGKVIGVIFAASVTDDRTGYALTAAQVEGAAAAGVDAHDQADTGSCSV